MSTRSSPKELPRRVPSTVLAACCLLAAGAAGTAILTVRGAMSIVDLEGQKSSDPASTAQILVLRIALSVSAAVLAIWMCWKNGVGRTWARNLTSVLAATALLAAVAALSVLRNRLAPEAAMTYLLSAILATAVLVLLWRPGSTAFFRASSLETVSAVRADELPGQPDSVTVTELDSEK
jgi:hypothetical protein